MYVCKIVSSSILWKFLIRFMLILCKLLIRLILIACKFVVRLKLLMSLPHAHCGGYYDPKN